MFCVKCKKNTDSVNLQHVVSKNNRNMKRGQCTFCGSTKTQFVSGPAGLPGSLRPTGKGVVNNIINKLPFEFHLPGHNFTGPGTNLKKRLNKDGIPKFWSKPVNRVDKAAYNHDVCYSKNKDTGVRNNLCDKNMLTELENIFNPSLREKLDKSIVKKIIGTKTKFGLGIEPVKKSRNLVGRLGK